MKILAFILITEISEDFVYNKDSANLLKSGKKILANNFIVNLNKFFLDTHTHHPPISL